MSRAPRCTFVFFFNDTATTEIYTLSLHDALPIFKVYGPGKVPVELTVNGKKHALQLEPRVTLLDALRDSLDITGADRKSTRLNSSHANISYAVFCLTKKKESDVHAAPLMCRTSSD